MRTRCGIFSIMAAYVPRSAATPAAARAQQGTHAEATSNLRRTAVGVPREAAHVALVHHQVLQRPVRGRGAFPVKSRVRGRQRGSHLRPAVVLRPRLAEPWPRHHAARVRVQHDGLAVEAVAQHRRRGAGDTEAVQHGRRQARQQHVPSPALRARASLSEGPARAGGARRRTVRLTSGSSSISAVMRPLTCGWRWASKRNDVFYAAQRGVAPGPLACTARATRRWQPRRRRRS